MKLKFDFVRIGESRKDSFSELLLKQNSELLKSDVDFFFNNCDTLNDIGLILLTIVIPGKGYNVKMNISNVQDSNIRKLLRENFKQYIYKGSVDNLIENINNKIFTK